MTFLFNLFVGWFGAGFVAAGLLLAAYFFVPPVPWLTERLRKGLLAASIHVAIATAIWGVAYGNGWNEHAAAVAAQDRRAVDAAERGRADVADCFGAGGVWDTAAGQCRRR